MKKAVFSFSAVLSSLVIVTGLRITEFSVPQHAFLNESLQLVCKYDLEQDTLLSLKWYKDGYEFFRYCICNRPAISRFPVNGVFVDMEAFQEINQITLRNISQASAGEYICQVSSDEPTFKTAEKRGYVMVSKVEPHLKEVIGLNITNTATSGGDDKQHHFAFISLALLVILM